MTDAAKEARRAYKRAWAQANPEKVKQYQDNYWQKKAQEQATPAPPIHTQERQQWKK